MKRLGGALILIGGLVLGVALGALILIGSGSGGRQQERMLPPTVGAKPAEFTLPALDGTEMSLASWKGQPVVINFWATWCPPCRDEMPLLEATANNYAGTLAVVGVNYAEDAQVVQPFVDEFGITFPILLDLDGRISDRYFVRSYPATFFLDADGVLRAQHIGLLTEEDLNRYLAVIGLEPKP